MPVTVLLLSMFETINLSLLKILFQEKNILEVFLIRLDSSSNVYSIRLDDAEEKENKKKAREEMLKTANMRWTVDYRHHRRHHHHILHMRWVNLTN